MQNIIREQIRKKVTRSGNGGAVWVPKDWLGEEIIITRLETPKLSIEEEIISILLPNLEKVIAIFLYGYYVRNEQTKNSDIDVLVIVKEKFKIDSVKRLDVSLLELSEARKAVHENPFIYSIIKESKAIINDSLLDELRKESNDFRIFIKWYAKTSLDNINSSKELIELDRMESEYLDSYSVIYSTMLRLRGIFLINSVLE
ncbi:nucleotidyltransferase domain-containing protein, partial [Candidatus Woesearchaeota archaeon]|nr:nucleotidyltransferase domain-containing protein [Candidatus Woesearchaeota archaeon]